MMGGSLGNGKDQRRASSAAEERWRIRSPANTTAVGGGMERMGARGGRFPFKR